MEVLIGSEESDELWHLDDLDVSGSVDIEMSPGLGEVGGEVRGEFFTADFLMGAENLGGSGLGGEFVNPESTGWETILILGFESVAVDHGSHEDIIGISRESLWGSSGVSSGTDGTGESRNEVVTSELDVFFFVIGGVGLRLLEESDTFDVSVVDLNSVGFDGGESEEGSNSKSVFHFDLSC